MKQFTEEVFQFLDRYVQDGLKPREYIMHPNIRGVFEAYQYLREENKKLSDFVRFIRDSFDCDKDGHKYKTHCRCCDAEKLIGAKS